MVQTEYKYIRDGDWEAARQAFRRVHERVDKLEGHGGQTTRFANLRMNGKRIKKGPTGQFKADGNEFITKDYLSSKEAGDLINQTLKPSGKSPLIMPDEVPAVMDVYTDIWGYWNMNATSGTRVDNTQQGHDLAVTLPTGVGYDTGVIGNCLKLTSSVGGPELFYNGFPDLTSDRPFTMAFWFKITDPVGYWNYSLDVNTPVEFWMDVGPTGLWPYVYTPGAVYCDDAGPFTVAAWHFFMIKYDGSTLKLKMDNVYVGTPTTGSSGLTTGQIYLWQEGGAGCNGWMDMYGIWRRCLTDAEDDYLWNGGVGREIY